MDTNSLILSHQKLAYRLAGEIRRRYRSPQYDRDRMESVGLAALVEAANSSGYDKSRPFAPFAAARIRGALLDEIRGDRHCANSGGRPIYELQAPELGEGDEWFDTVPGSASEAATVVAMDEWWDEAMSGLDGRDRMIVEGYYRHGIGTRELSAQHGIHKANISAAKNKALIVSRYHLARRWGWRAGAGSIPRTGYNTDAS